jgi:lipopolysaccharide export system protein LptA
MFGNSRLLGLYGVIITNIRKALIKGPKRYFVLAERGPVTNQRFRSRDALLEVCAMIVKNIEKFFVLFILILSTAILAASAVSLLAAGNAELQADSMNYDPKSRSIVASGNVRFRSPEGEISADRGIGYTDGTAFEMEGNARGRFKAQSLDIACDFIMLERTASPDRRIITASGGVKLSRDGGTLAADEVVWELGSENYSASGKVLLDFGNYLVDSDEASRDGDRFHALNIRRYEDRLRRITITAMEADGMMERGDMTELIADGGVVMDVAGEGDAHTRITGDKGVFSRDRGTLVISGGAFASQKGRNLRAASIVYHLDSGRVEALGDRPSIAFEMSD